MHISKLHIYPAASACLAPHVVFEEQNGTKLVHFSQGLTLEAVKVIKSQVSVELDLGEESKQL